MKRSNRPPSRIRTPLILVLLAAILWLAWDWLPGGSPGPVERPSVSGDGALRDVYLGPPNSIAVLPFRSSAPNRETAAHAEGFAGELLKALIAIPALQVTARSSSFFFRQRGGDYRIIAERLQCTHLLDGEWSSGPEGVELALLLFDARTSREVWRSLYSASLPELLAMREGIIADVVAALPVAPQEEIRLPPLPDIRAWTRYAEGLLYADPSADPDPARAADALYEALAIDPGFTAARLELAQVWLHPAWIAAAGGTRAVDDARAAVEAVLDVDPDSGRGWALMGYILHRHDWDWDGAARAGRRAAELSAGDAGALGVASLALSTVGEFELAHDFLEESVRRDPLNLGSRLRLGLLQEFRGEFDSALATYRQLLSMNPDYPGARAYRTRVKLLQGKADSALREADEESDLFWRRYARMLVLNAEQETSEADALMQETIADYGSVAAFQIAEILAFGGDRDRAFEWLERAYGQRDAGLTSTIGNRFFENLHADPRWRAWLTRLGLEAYAASEANGR